MDTIITLWKQELLFALCEKRESIKAGDIDTAYQWAEYHKFWSDEFSKVRTMSRGDYAQYLYQWHQSQGPVQLTLC